MSCRGESIGNWGLTATEQPNSVFENRKQVIEARHLAQLFSGFEHFVISCSSYEKFNLQFSFFWLPFNFHFQFLHFWLILFNQILIFLFPCQVDNQSSLGSCFRFVKSEVIKQIQGDVDTTYFNM